MVLNKCYIIEFYLMLYYSKKLKLFIINISIVNLHNIHIMMNNTTQSTNQNQISQKVIYIQKLVSNKYYVGITDDYDRRSNEHINGTGSAWTSKFKPLPGPENVKLIPCDDKHSERSNETIYTLYTMLIHGINNVRGGPWCKINLHPQDVLNIVTLLDTMFNRCNNCHIPGHSIRECKTDNTIKQTLNCSKCNTKKDHKEKHCPFHPCTKSYGQQYPNNNSIKNPITPFQILECHNIVRNKQPLFIQKKTFIEICMVYIEKILYLREKYDVLSNTEHKFNIIFLTIITVLLFTFIGSVMSEYTLEEFIKIICVFFVQLVMLVMTIIKTKNIIQCYATSRNKQEHTISSKPDSVQAHNVSNAVFQTAVQKTVQSFIGDSSAHADPDICRYYTNGHCKFGEKCKFPHPKNLVSSESSGDSSAHTDSDICRHYTNGHCKFGEKCRFPHQKNLVSLSGSSGSYLIPQ